MLKIQEISKDLIPEVIWDKFASDISDDFINFYISEGMFGSLPDYLLIITEVMDIELGFQCYGYVYNGNEPAFSEFGSFGLNSDKTERIW